MELHGTTIVGVKKDGKCAIAGDGQVTLGEQVVMKATAKKVRRIYHDRVIIGFAGGVADAFALTEKFEAKLEQFSGSLMRSAVELARDWRSDKAMRNLEAMLICTDGEELLVVSGWYAILIYPPKRSPEKPLRLQGKSVSLPTTISQ